jgi:hypothetical protein
MLSRSGNSTIRQLARILAIGCILAAGVVCGQDRSAADAAIDRAVAYLSKEVPAWRAENGCFSCHNNGDGARALYLARRLGREVDPRTLAETDEWLGKPSEWQAAGRQEAGDSGAKLATIQFSAALLESFQSGGNNRTGDESRTHLRDAARLIAAAQEGNGSWSVSAKGTLGAPATYGPFLATATVRDVLRAAGDPLFDKPIFDSENWLCTQKPQSVLDASATILGLNGAEDNAAIQQRRRCLELLRSAQQEDGGWGPFANAPPEPFDTAIALIALATFPKERSKPRMIDRGRRYLLATQLDGGSWPETTRPAGAVSYAQHISTTAWALQALLVSESASLGDRIP